MAKKMKIPELLARTIEDGEVVTKNGDGRVIERLGKPIFNPKDQGECIGYTDKKGKEILLENRLELVKRCNAQIEFGDDFGDNTSTFFCKLNKGHKGKHKEIGDMAYADDETQPYILQWNDLKKKSE